MTHEIAFVGLGNMGLGMCANLVQAGFHVAAFDINPDAVARAVAKGAIPKHSIAEAVAGADFVLTMLPNGETVASVYFSEAGIVSAAEPNAFFIDCSTISVEEARRNSSAAVRAGHCMIDAPVSGGTSAAEAGALTFMVGGTAEEFERARPVLDAMGKLIIHAGGPGNGQAAKIANNMLLGISMIATCEAFALAEKLGVNAQTFFEISSKASGQNWSMTSYCPVPGPVPSAPSNRDYEPGFAAEMMLKDLRLAAAASDFVGAEFGLGALAESIYAQLCEEGLGRKDFSIVMRSLV